MSKMERLYLSSVVIFAQFCGYLDAAFFEAGDNHTTSIAARAPYDIGERSVYWPSGYVPYQFADYFDDTHKDIVRAVFREFKNYCINFEEVEVVDRLGVIDYVSIEYDTAKLKPKCHADTGRIGGKQFMTFSSSDCFKFHVIKHQVLHTLGFWHEHQRNDRDCFIRFKYTIDTNTGPLQKNKKLSTAFPYDIHSLTHFGLFYIDYYRQVSGNPTEHWRGWPFKAATTLTELDKYVVKYIYCHHDRRPVGHVYNDDYSPVKWCREHRTMCDDFKQIIEECGYTGPQPVG